MDPRTIIVSEALDQDRSVEIGRFVSISEAMRFAERAARAGKPVHLHRQGVRPPKLDLWGHLSKGPRMAGEGKSRPRRDPGAL